MFLLTCGIPKISPKDGRNMVDLKKNPMIFEMVSKVHKFWQQKHVFRTVYSSLNMAVTYIQISCSSHLLMPSY